MYTNKCFAVKSTPKLNGCLGFIFVTKGELFECPITVDLNSVRVEILVNEIPANSTTTQMVVLPILTADPVDVK